MGDAPNVLPVMGYEDPSLYGNRDNYMRDQIQNAIDRRGAYRLANPGDLQLATVPGSSSNEMSMTQDITSPGATAIIGNALRNYQDSSPWGAMVNFASGYAAHAAGFGGVGWQIARNVMQDALARPSQSPFTYRPKYTHAPSSRSSSNRSYLQYTLKSSRKRKYSRKRF